MKIEPKSKAEARMLKRVRLSQHWTARIMAPIALCILPLVVILGGLHLWCIGYAKAVAYVVCIDTGNQLVPVNGMPLLSYFPSAFVLTIGLFFVMESWLVMFVLRERRIMNDILKRVEAEDSERHF